MKRQKRIPLGYLRSRQWRDRRLADDTGEDVLEDWMAAPGDVATSSYQS